MFVQTNVQPDHKANDLAASDRRGRPARPRAQARRFTDYSTRHHTGAARGVVAHNLRDIRLDGETNDEPYVSGLRLRTAPVRTRNAEIAMRAINVTDIRQTFDGGSDERGAEVILI